MCIYKIDLNDFAKGRVGCPSHGKYGRVFWLMMELVVYIYFACVLHRYDLFFASIFFVVYINFQIEKAENTSECRVFLCLYTPA